MHVPFALSLVSALEAKERWMRTEKGTEEVLELNLSFLV